MPEIGHFALLSDHPEPAYIGGMSRKDFPIEKAEGTEPTKMGLRACIPLELWPGRKAETRSTPLLMTACLGTLRWALGLHARARHGAADTTLTCKV
jgi:hypothetical protein